MLLAKALLNIPMATSREPPTVTTRHPNTSFKAITAGPAKNKANVYSAPVNGNTTHFHTQR